MTRKLLAAMVISAVVGTAGADISAFVTPPTPVTLAVGQAYYQDIFVEVDPGDSWTVGSVRLSLDSDHYFYQDPLDANPPNPALFGSFPDLEYTSFYTSPGDWPNTAYDGTTVVIAVTNDTPNMLATDWVDLIDPEMPAGGDFMVARFTVVGDSDYIGLGEFLYASRENPEPQRLPLPEPAGLALLVLGGLVVARRR